ncbi:hypothetical protein ACFQAT_27230 [Undibacterium arcticum]|uniref:HTH IS21-type domain-containing protein n=1 Tax=Undibacterium arcticum TaxID=1762892 RepID=A0ABV7EZB3_9BURK
MISYELWCQIRDCRDRQHMTLGQIATALHLHHQTVATWASVLHYEARKKVVRSSLLDPFKGQVTRLLDTHRSVPSKSSSGCVRPAMVAVTRPSRTMCA